MSRVYNVLRGHFNKDLEVGLDWLPLQHGSEGLMWGGWLDATLLLHVFSDFKIHFGDICLSIARVFYVIYKETRYSSLCWLVCLKAEWFKWSWLTNSKLNHTRLFLYSFLRKMVNTSQMSGSSLRQWCTFYVGKWVLSATTELHAIVFFQWFELTSLLEQTHSRAPHIENLKSTPCGQFYFNPGRPASPSCLRPDQGFGCHCYSKCRADLVITVVSGVALASMLKPKIIYIPANRLL